jgi:hypothetical protein
MLMDKVSDIFDVLGGPSAVARLLNVKPSTAGEMKRRGSIPSEYWQDLILAAKRRRISGLDADRLVALHARAAAPAASLADSGNVPTDLPASMPSDMSAASTGQFSRFRHLRRSNFSSAAAVNDHVSALRDEWSH